MSYNQQFESYVAQVEQALPAFLPAENPLYKDLTEAMAYSLLSGGKRIRAVLSLAFYNLYHADVAAAMPFAAAIEMIHAYSLIHDDLPCMDDDDMRRGKPSCHIAFGESTALLAGDALLTHAFETVLSPENMKRFDADKLLKAAHCLAQSAGTHGMIGGQAIDLAHEGKKISPETLAEMDRKKTGALIAAAAQMGAIAAGAPQAEIEAARDYAYHIGLAFQIVDDILDCTADEQTLGKPVGSDIENDKSTYVSLYGLDGARSMIDEQNRLANEALAKIDRDTGFLAFLADMLSRREK